MSLYRLWHLWANTILWKWSRMECFFGEIYTQLDPSSHGRCESIPKLFQISINLSPSAWKMCLLGRCVLSACSTHCWALSFKLTSELSSSFHLQISSTNKQLHLQHTPETCLINQSLIVDKVFFVSLFFFVLLTRHWQAKVSYPAPSCHQG